MVIVDKYVINDSSMAIIPAKQIDYYSVVAERNQVVYVRQTPLEIIKHSCLHYWSTYEGRKEAVIYHTGFKRKVPIPIDLEQEIITFPTHAIDDIDCSWILYHQIINIISIKKNETKVLFDNGQSLNLKISKHILLTQMKRSLEILHKIKRLKFSG